MRPLIGTLKKVLGKRADRNTPGGGFAKVTDAQKSNDNELPSSQRSWWSGFPFRSDSHDEFAKWWNHWMSRIPSTRPVITTSRAGKRDV